MLNQLRGRNLAHVGCTIGLVLGLLLGMIAGIILISLVRTAAAADWAALVWIGLTTGHGGSWVLWLVEGFRGASGEKISSAR